MGDSPDSEEHGPFDGMAVEHVLGGLSEDDSRTFRAHLLECTHCRARVGELRSIAHQLADVERDEARERVTKPLETKRRDEDEPPPDPGGPRVSLRARLGVAALLVVIAVLAGWNVLLRGQVGDLEDAIDAREDASQALEFGAAWDVEANEEDIAAEVREDDGSLALRVDGLSETTYHLRLLEEDGEVLAERAAVPTDGGLLLLMPGIDPEVTELVLVGDDGPVLRADRHADGAPQGSGSLGP